MNQEYEKRLEEIIGVLECPKDFKCYKSGFEVLCQARDIGSESFLECLEEDPEGCKFSFAFFGYAHLCQCPLRVYIAKKLKN
jgi:hypothetical protein